MSLILVEKDETFFSVLDTADGVVEHINKRKLFSFMRDNRELRIRGISYNEERDKFFTSIPSKYVVNNGYCLTYNLTGKGTLNVGVSYVLYECGTGEQVASGYFNGAKSDYINCTIERFTVNISTVCILRFGYFDKHYFSEDVGIELSTLIEYIDMGTGQYIEGRNLRWVERKYAYQNKDGGEVEFID